MNVAAWIVAVVLAALYLTAGTLKSTQPRERLAGPMPWTNDLALPQIRFIGVAELLGALGLVLPKLLGVVDPHHGVDGTLTGLAAAGLAAIQAGAIVVHLKRREPSVLPLNIVLLLAAAFVAAARFGWL